jgi:O-antigen/teichoic acid export membrane protein
MALVILFATDTMSVWSAGLVIILGTVLPPLIVFLPLLRTVAVRPAATTVRAAAKYGSRSWVGAVANMVNVRLDQLLLIPLVPPSALGFYAVAASVASLLAPASGAIATVIFARAARQTELPRMLRAVRVTVLATLVLASVLGGLVPIVAPVLFGARFGPVVPLALILIVGAVAVSGTAAVGALTAGYGFPGVLSIAEGAAVAITVAGLLLFVPVAGTVAAATVSTLAYWCAFGLGAKLGAAKLQVSVSEVVVFRRSDIQYMMIKARALATRVQRGGAAAGTS